MQNLSYVWDTAGNLSHRQDLRQSITETFSYDAIGSVTSKTGVGSYTYSPALIRACRPR